MSANPLTTHVLDTSTGKPAANLAITLEKEVVGEFIAFGKAPRRWPI